MKQESWDVVVVGGGSAGIAAGILAARAGARTLIIDRNGYLGGVATASLVHTVCGLYRIREEPDAEYANQGFPREFAEAMIQSGASPGPMRMGKLDVLPHFPAGFALVADSLCEAESRLTVRFHSEVYSVGSGADGWEVGLACRGNIESIRAKTLVDCSGDGVAAELAGLPVERAPGDRLQRPSYVVGFQGLPDSWLSDEGRLLLAQSIVEGIRHGRLPREATGAHFRETGRKGELFCTIDLNGGESYDPTDGDSLTFVERQGRDLANQLLFYFRNHVDGLESMYLSHLPARAGIRESRRVLTRHMMTGEEVLSGEDIEDGIAGASWPMEIREKPTGPKWKFPKSESPVQIPLRSLRVEGHDGFFVAGRCLGATHEAQAAIRVMGTCLATGAAAGVAAAIQADRGFVDAEAIRSVYQP